VMLADRPGVVFLACVGGNRLEYIVRPADTDMHAAMLARYAEFWKAVDNNEEPEPNYQKDVDALMELYRHAETGKIHDATGDNEIVAHILNHRKWGAEIKKLKALQDSAKVEVLQRVEDASKVVALNIDDKKQLSIACGETKENPGKVITEAMVGEVIGKRKGSRMFRTYEKDLDDNEFEKAMAARGLTHDGDE